MLGGLVLREKFWWGVSAGVSVIGGQYRGEVSVAEVSGGGVSAWEASAGGSVLGGSVLREQCWGRGQ